MKFLILLLVGASAHADLTCDAHEIMAGNVGRTGQAVIGDQPFSFSWKGDDKSLNNATQFCGEDLAQGVKCATVDTSYGFTDALNFNCKKEAPPAMPGEHRDDVAYGRFVRSRKNGVGRYSCTGTTQAKTVEFSNCK